MKRPPPIKEPVGDGATLHATGYTLDPNGGAVTDLSLYNGKPTPVYADKQVPLQSDLRRRRFRKRAAEALPELDLAALDAVLLKLARGLVQALAQARVIDDGVGATAGDGEQGAP